MAGALYVIAAIGALALNATGSGEPTRHRVAAGERPGQTPDIQLPDVSEVDADTASTGPVEDADDAVNLGQAIEIKCTTEEQEMIAAAATKARDDVLAQVDEVKEQRLSDLGLLDGGGELPDFVETDLDSIDNAGEAALDEVDRKVADAGDVCVAGGDPQAILNTL